MNEKQKNYESSVFNVIAKYSDQESFWMIDTGTPGDVVRGEGG